MRQSPAMRIAFMGTPDFAVPSLAELIAAGHEIVAVYSQPPRPRGRGQKLTSSPVHAFAESMGLPVFTPDSMKAPDAIETFRSLDLDAAAVVAYGQILKTGVLEAPRLGCFNLHGSLLPRWRGAAPIQRAIMAGDRQTGVRSCACPKVWTRARSCCPRLWTFATTIPPPPCRTAWPTLAPGCGPALWRPSSAGAQLRWNRRASPPMRKRSPPLRRASTGPVRRPKSTVTSAASHPSPAPGSRGRTAPASRR